MTLKINTNIAALNAHRSMLKNDTMLGDSLERLSTGLRINKAADDSSGMAIADSLRAQSLGIGQAIRNANGGISMVQAADGALQESINIINTVKTKAIQAASDGQTTGTRRAIQNDIDKLLKELDAIAKTTSFNGQKLLSGAFTNKAIQIGAFADETSNISISSSESNKVGHISQADLSLAGNNGGEVQLTITSSITGEQLTLNTIDIQYNNKRENGIGAMADEINRYTSITGISAKSVIETTTVSSIKAGTTGWDFSINGVTIGAIPVEANDYSGSLVNAINSKSAETGVEAFLTIDGKLTMKSIDGRSIKVEGSVTDVMGSTSGQMSGLGYLKLTQSGVSQFQINGIGAGATGGDITISGDMETVEDSIIASGSTIKTGSKLASGTIIGGDMLVESSIASTQLDYNLKSGSTLYATTQLAKGSVIGGAITVGGDTIASSSTGTTALEEDMLITSGTTLEQFSTLGKGTVITTAFTSSASGSVVTYTVGNTLTSSVLLTRDVTVNAGMTLKYSSTAADNTKIKAGTILANGSRLGAEFEIGVSYNSSAANVQVTTGVATTTDIYLTAALTGSTEGGATIKAGSLLADDTALILASDSSGTMTWTGPTLITDSGTIEYGNTVQRGQVYTLSGDQVLSGDIVTEVNDGTTYDSYSITSGSILVTGFTAVDLSAGGTGETTTLASATLADDMTLKSGSELSAGSKLLAGSELGNSTYVMGGSLSSSATDVTTYARTELKSGSKIESGSILAEGSTIGGSITMASLKQLDSDMSVTAGTLLAANTILKAGTTLTQDMTLNSATSGASATEIEVKAGDVLTTDLYVDADTTLSEDMMLASKSTLEAGSILAVNTSNAGTVGLSDTETYRLADVSVLDQENAQRAISIADSALKGLDEVRSNLGSVQNQLASTISNLSVTKTNIQASESSIRDVDFADESMIFSKMQLLSQTSSYALAQANASAQNVMNLLQ
ncbi:MAG: flagellin [Proteobacteria bacterium]|nr:flagellin [Pseudomonadota bacterium]MBU1581166.1 flagellin [Pseudomonadota bacterium]